MSNVEQTECYVPKVFVFSVPPRTSSTGHRAADWPKEHLWSGRFRLVSTGDKSSILLENSDGEGLFARCPIDNKSTVEQVTDSSRYFVIKVSDGKGKNAYLGVAFEKREEALEFKIALQTAMDRNSADKKASEFFGSQPAVAALPSDGSIEVDLVGKLAKKKKEKDAAAAAAAGASGAAPAVKPASGNTTAGFAIAPPKASEKKGRKAAHAAAAAGASGAANASVSAAAAPASKPVATTVLAPAAGKSGQSSAAPTAAAASLDTDATLLEAFGAAPPPTAVAAPVADPLAFFSAGK